MISRSVNPSQRGSMMAAGLNSRLGEGIGTEVQGAPVASDLGAQLCFVIRPNPSMDGRALVLCFLLIVSCSLSVAIGCYLGGLVLVLPFSGLELTALGGALFFTFRQARYREVITLSPDRVQVQIGRETPTRCWSSQRCWTRVVLQPSPYRRHPGRLLLRSCGRELELGKCLCEEEKRALAKRLEGVLSF